MDKFDNGGRKFCFEQVLSEGDDIDISSLKGKQFTSAMNRSR
jgi:hypothetical protein